jgi:hypothetical protein
VEDLLEFVNRRPCVPDIQLETVLDMVVDERVRCVSDSHFDRVKLPRHVHAIATRFDHGDCFVEMLLGTLESGHDILMRQM